MEYRYGSYRWYRSVFVTKYRYKVLKDDVGLKVRKLIRQTCEAFEIEILKGVVSQAHSGQMSHQKRSDLPYLGVAFILE